jgi:GGDEF domain-containing protein
MDNAPTPWILVNIMDESGDCRIEIIANDDDYLFTINYKEQDEEKAVNLATRIIDAVNSHASLVEALETIANKHIGYEGYPEDKFLSALTDLRTLIKIAQSALAQAKGEAK